MSLEAQAPKDGKGPTRLLVPFVISVGIFVGVLLSYLIPLPYGVGPLAYFADQIRNLLILDMVVATVSISLLVALVVVYLRIYAKTGAKFALGILAVMFALLFQALFRYPLLLAFTGRIVFQFGSFLTVADLFSIAAYSILFYLSLE